MNGIPAADQRWTCVCGQPNVGRAACTRCLAAAPPWVPVAPSPPVRSRHLGAGFVALVVAVVVLLVAALAGVLLVGDDEPEGDFTSRTVRVAPTTAPGAGSDQSTSVPASTSTTAADPAGAEFTARIAELQRFVEDARGLKFVRPVDVKLLSEADFRARISEEERTEEDREELRQTGLVLIALGLLDRDVDLEKAVDDFFGSAVAGFYDPETDELVVRGSELDKPSVRVTVVHELVHALQDQVFELHRPELDEADDERSTGFTGLVEGDAVRIEELYLASLSRREQKQAEREELEASAAISRDVPDILFELVLFPYAVGPDFTRAVVRAGGQARLDEAFANPPTTSEHLIHPERFLRGEAMVEVLRPEADGEVIDEGTVGEYGFLLVLSRVLGQAEAFEAAEGWGGDWYRAWERDGGACVRARVVMDSESDTRELGAALEQWADEHGGVELTADGGGHLFTACG